MKISKKDALMWFRFFAELPEDEPLMPHQQELAWAVISQIETAVDARHKELMAQIPDLHTLGGRTYFVGDPANLPELWLPVNEEEQPQPAAFIRAAQGM